MRYRALLVEDDRMWEELLSEMLQDLGFTVHHVATYQAAEQAIIEGPYELGLFDVSLVAANHENQDGLRVLEEFRAHYPTTPAIILTGFATVDLTIQALTQLKANDFLRKEQFERRRFQETVQRVLGHRSTHLSSSASIMPIFAQPVIIEPLNAHILVVEDNTAWQNIYEELLEEVGADFSLAVSYGEAHGLLRRTKFDAAVVDLKLISSTKPQKNRDGFYLLRLTHQLNVPTIVVSALGQPQQIDQAYEEHKIFAFLDKEGFQRTTFIKTLRDAIAHKIEPNTLTSPSFEPIEGSPLANLTRRQLEVLELLAEGMTNNEIAEEIVVSVNTVKKHVLAIFKTLQVNTRSAAAAIAARYGLGANRNK